jgi:hypothetical protein
MSFIFDSGYSSSRSSGGAVTSTALMLITAAVRR